MATVFGNGSPTNTLDDFDEAEILLLIGSNTTEVHPIIANRMKKAVKAGLKMIVIDSRRIDMVKVAHRHLQIEVGADIALMNGMMHIIIAEGLYDKEWVQQHTTDFERLKEQVKGYTPDYTSMITGLKEADIIETSREYAQAKNSMIAYTLGITEHHGGVNNVFDIANIALLTGHVGRRGKGIMPLRGENNVQGAGDMGCLPNLLTGSRPLTDHEYRKRFENHWGVEMNPHVGDTQTSTFEKMENGHVKALYVIGENPLLADVHLNHTKRLLENLDLLVVQDIFVTETAKMADVVLPAKSWGEVEGTYTNTDRRIQRVREAVRAHPNVKEDWEILCELSKLMGYEMKYQNSEEVWEEVWHLAHEVYGGITYRRLEKEYSLHYPCPHETHPGTFVLHERFHQPTKEEQKKSPFVQVFYTPPVEVPDDDYPFMLTTGRRYETYNTHTQTRYYASGVKLKQITEQVVPGLVFMSFHWSEVPTNILTINEYDPISGTAEYKARAVKLSKIR